MVDLLKLLVSLCFAEFIHNLIEIWGMRQKAEWLSMSLDGKEHRRWPVDINTKFKTIILHLLILLIVSSIAYFLLTFLNFNNESLVFIGITILLINYLTTTWLVDKFHSEIGKLIYDAKNSEAKNK
jgi:hypothetical protein